MLPLLHSQKFYEALPIAIQINSILKRCTTREHPLYIHSLVVLVTIYLAIYKYPSAAHTIDEVLKINLGSVQLLYDFAKSLMRSRRFDAAEMLLKRVFKSMSSLVGKSHANIAVSLNQLGMLYYSVGKYYKAKKRLLQALKIWENSKGKKDLFYSDICVNLGLTCHALGFYPMTEHFIITALRIRRTKLGKRHHDYLQVLRLLNNLYDGSTNLGMSYHKKGEFDKAEMLYLGALKVRHKLLGKNNLKYASSLNDLGLLYTHLGKYDKAETLYLEALTIIRKLLGKRLRQHIYADMIGNIGALYARVGNYRKARPLLEQAVEIKRAKNYDYALSLNNLLGLYLNIGDYSQLHSLSEQVLSPVSLSRIKEISTKLKIKNTFGLLYWKLGDYSRAESLLEEVVKIGLESPEDYNQDLPTYLGNLGAVYISNNKYSKAKSLLEKALGIGPVSLKNDVKYSNIINNLGMLYYFKGQYSKAEPLLRQAKNAVKKSLGESHPNYISCLDGIALLYSATGRILDAFNTMRKARDKEDMIMEQIFYITSQRQRMEYTRTLMAGFYTYLSFVTHYLSTSQKEVGKSMNLVLSRKGVVADVYKTNRETILTKNHPELKTKLRQLDSIRKEKGDMILSGPSFNDLSTFNKNLSELNTKIEKLEVDLGLLPENRTEAMKWQTLANRLPKDTVLIEFVKFLKLDYQSKPVKWKSAHYIAFVIQGGYRNSIKLVDIGHAETIDNLTNEYINIMFKAQTEDIDTLEGSVTMREIVDKGFALRKIILNDSLMLVLRNYKKVYVSPDGELSRLPIEALPLENDGNNFLIDIFDITYLSSGKDILHFKVKNRHSSIQNVILADPDFDFRSNPYKKVKQESHLQSPIQRISFRDLVKPVDPLPATRIEAKHIGNRIRAKPWLGREATESKLKKIESPFILHISTHGYFLSDPSDHLKEFKFTAGSPIIIETWWGGEPLLRAGLALAGSNRFIRYGQFPENDEDGILTAYDVTGLDLSNTELIVLSACETAKGKEYSGEGVFGFRRSFVLAGAQTLVMSLWRVPVAQTIILMNSFYRNLISGQGRSEALRSAKLELKKVNSHPFVWAPFICQGNPSAIYHSDRQI